MPMLKQAIGVAAAIELALSRRIAVDCEFTDLNPQPAVRSGWITVGQQNSGRNFISTQLDIN
jgi:hypothetical protein